MYKLSENSLKKLKGVNPKLVKVVKTAIKLTKDDFAVIDGVRDLETQKIYFAKGVSDTMDSKHLTGHAVDLMLYVAGRGCWEPLAYRNVADAMRQAAIQCGVSIRWGGNWFHEDIRTFDGAFMDDLIRKYKKIKASRKEDPFVDAPHFELN